MEKQTKRINFDIPTSLHTKIKTIASQNGISIKLWILRTILQEIALLSEYNINDYLKNNISKKDDK